MFNDLHELRVTLRQRLRDGFKSYAMADWVLALVMPEVRRSIMAERERLAAVADDMGAGELATAIRSGKAVDSRLYEDPWARVLPFAEA